VPDPAVPLLTAAEMEFLDGLGHPPEPKALDDLPKDDRLFIGGLVKRLHSRQLEMPVFPEVAIKLSDMLRQGDQPVSRYVTLLNEAPALSVEVLKAANSAFYGAARHTSSLNEAIMRIGLTRLQAILLMGHLKARILKSGAMQRKAELLMDLALPLGFLTGRLARQRDGVDLRFMRGMLMHVEHLVILGSVTDISREQRTPLNPSVEGMLQAFVRVAPDIRHALATAWQLQEILLGTDDAKELVVEYAALREALISRWLDRPLPAIEGVDPDVLAEMLSHVAPRVPPGDEALSA
jgi:HD-like signal output (HDOD) protein